MRLAGLDPIGYWESTLVEGVLIHPLSVSLNI